MPVCNLNVLRGHPKVALQNWIREASTIVAEVLGAPMGRLEVWVTEIDPDLWGIEGRPANEAFALHPRSELEMPLIRMVLLAGRTVEQHHRLIATLTEMSGRVLDVRADRVRIQIDEVSPDRWGIGGVPASVRRAAEIAERAAQAPPPSGPRG